MEFEFYSTTRIIFGKGSLSKIETLAGELGKKALIVTGRSSERANVVFEALIKQNIPFSQFIVEGEPTINLVEAGIEHAKAEKCDFIIGFGGGSVLDSGKAIASLLNNDGEIIDYLEVVGKGKTITKPSLPYIAIPTTSGTGTEVTRNAVLTVPEKQVKVSLRSPYLLPKVAIIDPELVYALPPDITARTGLDALTQLIEPYTSNQTNPIVDGLCREGIQRAARSLLRAFENGQDEKAREDMSVASLFGGLALANGKLGVVHAIAGPMGGMFPIPHGTACACILPFAIEVNITALRNILNSEEKLQRYEEIARLVTGNPKASIDDGIAWIKGLCMDLKVPRLSDYGIKNSDFPSLIEKSLRASSMKGNPVKLTTGEMEIILNHAI